MRRDRQGPHFINRPTKASSPIATANQNNRALLLPRSLLALIFSRAGEYPHRVQIPEPRWSIAAPQRVHQIGLISSPPSHFQEQRVAPCVWSSQGSPIREDSTHRPKFSKVS
jgi:hypothetical protein